MIARTCRSHAGGVNVDSRDSDRVTGHDVTATDGQRGTRRFSLAAKVVVIGGATCLTLLAVCAAGELSVRYRERHRATVPGTMPLLFYRHDRLGHALVRNMNYFGWVTIDSNGFRVTPGAAAGVAPKLRIFADGGSTTFDGNTGADERTWPARLQYWLTQLAPESAVEVANAGVPGYRTVDNLIRLQTELSQFRPDMVVLLQGHNDLFGALRYDTLPPPPDPERPGEIQTSSFLRSWLAKHSLFYAKIQERLNVLAFRSRGRRSLARAEASAAAFDGRLAAGVERFERDLRGYIAIARALGIQVVIPALVHVTAPADLTVAGPEADAWRNAMPFAPPEIVLKGYRMYNDVIRRVADQTGAIYVDTRTFGLQGQRFYDQGDPIHFSAAGADVMGRHLAQVLLQTGVVSSPGTARQARAR
jgi:lysophospholipase L1-like esterase